MKRHIGIYSLRPANIDVLGHRVTETDAAWTGLDWSRAICRDSRSKISVPWCHPDDQTGDPDDFDCVYSVYPQAMAGKRWRRRMVKDAWFERAGEKWVVIVEYAKPLPRS
jgi:hypothetical protein